MLLAIRNLFDVGVDWYRYEKPRTLKLSALTLLTLNSDNTDKQTSKIIQKTRTTFAA